MKFTDLIDSDMDIIEEYSKILLNNSGLLEEGVMGNFVKKFANAFSFLKNNVSSGTRNSLVNKMKDVIKDPSKETIKNSISAISDATDEIEFNFQELSPEETEAAKEKIRSSLSISQLKELIKLMTSKYDDELNFDEPEVDPVVQSKMLQLMALGENLNVGFKEYINK